MSIARDRQPKCPKTTSKIGHLSCKNREAATRRSEWQPDDTPQNDPQIGRYRCNNAPKVVHVVGPKKVTFKSSITRRFVGGGRVGSGRVSLNFPHIWKGTRKARATWTLFWGVRSMPALPVRACALERYPWISLRVVYFTLVVFQLIRRAASFLLLYGRSKSCDTENKMAFSRSM